MLAFQQVSVDVCQHMRFCVCVWCVCVYPHMHMYVLMLLGKEEEGEEITLFPVHHIHRFLVMADVLRSILQKETILQCFSLWADMAIRLTSCVTLNKSLILSVLSFFNHLKDNNCTYLIRLLQINEVTYVKLLKQYLVTSKHYIKVNYYHFYYQY